MLKKEGRFDQYAYRVAEFPISATLAASEFQDGIWVTINSNGELVKADGTKKAFVLLTSKKTGRDQISGRFNAQGTILMGASRVTTDQVKADDTYAPCTPLYVGADGKLTTTGVGLKLVVGTGGAVTATGTGDLPIVAGYALSDMDSDGFVTVYIVA